VSYSEILNRYQKHPELLECDLADAIRIDQQNMLSDMVRQAEIFMHWAILHAHADQAAKRQKRVVEEEILPRARVRAEAVCAENGRRATVQNMNDIAMSDPEYTVAVKLLEKLQQTAAVMKRVEEAFRQRKDMLQSLNSRQRVELESLPIDKPNKTFSAELTEGERAWFEPSTDGRGTDETNKKPVTDAEMEAWADRYKAIRKAKRS